MSVVVCRLSLSVVVCPSSFGLSVLRGRFTSLRPDSDGDLRPYALYALYSIMEHVPGTVREEDLVPRPHQGIRPGQITNQNSKALVRNCSPAASDAAQSTVSGLWRSTWPGHPWHGIRVCFKNPPRADSRTLDSTTPVVFPLATRNSLFSFYTTTTL